MFLSSHKVIARFGGAAVLPWIPRVGRWPAAGSVADRAVRAAAHSIKTWRPPFSVLGDYRRSPLSVLRLHGSNVQGSAIGGDVEERIVTRTPHQVRDPVGRPCAAGPSACEASLRRLGVDHIDLYYQYHIDTTISIEYIVSS
nr:uncharacterized protein LOC127319534 [Lolium perenne]